MRQFLNGEYSSVVKVSNAVKLRSISAGACVSTVTKCKYRVDQQ